LDPFQAHDDAILNRALMDACLVEKLDVDGEPCFGGDITLDTVVEEDGLNLSLGQVNQIEVLQELLLNFNSVVLSV
jgi:hypothetical protein